MKQQNAMIKMWGLVAVMAWVGTGWAADNSYIGNVGTGNWNDPTVWSSGSLPISSDSVWITNAVTASRHLTNNLPSTLIADLVISNSSTANINQLLVQAPTSAGAITYFVVTGNTTIGSNGVLNLARTTAVSSINVTNENLYLLDNALIRAASGSQYTINYVVNGAFSNSARTTISRDSRVAFNLRFNLDAPVVNNGTISYMNTDQAGMGSFTLRTTNTFVNNGTVVYGYGGNPSAAAEALTWQSMFVNQGLLSLINTNTRPTGMSGVVRFTVTGRTGHAFTNAENGTIRFFSNPATNTTAMNMELTLGDLVNLGTITSDARKDVTNVLTLAASGAVFSNAAGARVIVVNSNFTIRADNIVNLGTNLVQNNGLLTYQTRTGGANSLLNEGVLRLETGRIRALGGINNAANGLITGNGTLDGDVTSSGQIAPGLSIGTLTFSGNLTLPGTYKLEVDGSGAGSTDLISVAGQLDLTGGTLDVSVLNTLDDTAYVIASYGSLVGTFSTVTGLPAPYYVDYNYLGGNEIAIVIPEPSAAVLVGIGLIGGLWLLRTRRQRR